MPTRIEIRIFFKKKSFTGKLQTTVKALHDAGYVHSDLQEPNIMATSDGGGRSSISTGQHHGNRILFKGLLGDRKSQRAQSFIPFWEHVKDAGQSFKPFQVTWSL